MPFICFLFPKTRSEKLSEDLDEYDYFDTTPDGPYYQEGPSGLGFFIEKAEKLKKPSSFISCPCIDCKNKKEYSSSKALHDHLLTRVLEEENEEEEDDNIDFMQFNSFADTFMGDDADDEDSTDALAQTLHDAKEYCDNERD
ncbi:hypothetical protein U9M48_019149 [Paspalum notatum var. saurae]|uniref:Transposase-associated domain-containing protein n=1 Tax=Paspalum notatum var. saurae TaxID=547442 RepID=A0AAQ3TCJ8_PASNO